MTALAMALGMVAGVACLAMSAQWNIAAGGAIVLTVTALFAGSLLVAPWLRAEACPAQAPAAAQLAQRP
ncbi:hypothetical protein [Pseudofrankia sp. DC12]|uniref:hypothetical protein n=1 Tax=Pseudofrankia sp. DC12 TaxID=683315 RepID=UPI000B300005|nr:hypothetical protein [Pseudofrankia sp. DC12]